ELPGWCEQRSLPAEPGWRMHARALVNPRSDSARLALQIPDDVIAIADDPLSFPAVCGHPRSVVTMHYSTWLDRWALRRWRAKDVQDVRAERTAVTKAVAPTAYSSRVGEHFHAPFVPSAVVVPDQPLPIRDEPIAVLAAFWDWRP